MQGGDKIRDTVEYNAVQYNTENTALLLSESFLGTSLNLGNFVLHVLYIYVCVYVMHTQHLYLYV